MNQRWCIEKLNLDFDFIHLGLSNWSKIHIYLSNSLPVWQDFWQILGSQNIPMILIIDPEMHIFKHLWIVDFIQIMIRFHHWPCPNNLNKKSTWELFGQEVWLICCNHHCYKLHSGDLTPKDKGEDKTRTKIWFCLMFS